MPQITGPITSFGVPENAIDMSPAFYNIKNPATVLLDRIGVGKGASNTTIKWWDDNRMPIATALGADYVAASGSITVESVDGLRGGSVLRVGSTIFRVTAINPATKVVTVSTLASDANHSTGDTVLIVGNAQVENKDFESTPSVTKVMRENYTQIFQEGVEVSATQEVINRYVGEQNILNEDTARKMRHLYLQLGRAIWDGPKVEAVTNADARMMGGIRHFIDTYGLTPSAAAFSQANIDAFLLEMAGNGANLVEIWCNPVVAKKFAAFMEDQVIVERGDGTVGRHVRSYLSSIGVQLTIVSDPACSDTNAFYVFDTSMVSLRPLRSMQVKDIASTGDGTKKLLVGEYSLQFNNSALAGKFTITP